MNAADKIILSALLLLVGSALIGVGFFLYSFIVHYGLMVS